MKEKGIVDIKVFEFLSFNKVSKPREVNILSKREVS